jgi:hypothetical protein
VAAPAAAAAIDVYACTQCGAALMFDPATTSLACDHCGGSTKIELASAPVITYDLFGQTAIASLHARDLGAREIECKKCGAHAIVTKRADKCAFCAAPMVVDVDQGAATIPPGGVVPFVITGKDAAARFSKWLSGRWFAPGDLVAASRRDRMDGVYLPYWVFDAQSSTAYRGQRGRVYYETEHYKDASGNDQTRQVERIDWTFVSGDVHVASTDVLAIASETLPHKLVRKLEPWQPQSALGFDPRFLAGFIAECYRVQPSDGFKTAYEEVIDSQIRRAIERDIGGDKQRIDDINVNWDSVRFRHLLLPMWLSAFRYNDKAFHVAVNASTGEVVGERPYSAMKIVLFILTVAALIAAIVIAVTR